MKADSNRQPLDELIHAAIGRDNLPFDYERWKQEHQREISEFQSERSYANAPAVLSTGRRQAMTHILKIAAAAAVFIGVCLGVPYLGHRDNHGAAFAQLMEQIENAKTVTWKIIFYNQITSKDGQRRWIETEIRHQAYKAPGLYRDVHLDEKGGVHHWTVTNAINRKEISVNPEKRRAILRELATGTDDPRGPFVWVKEVMETHNLEWVGKRTTPTGEVNVFRTSFRDKPNNQDWSYDFWVDAKTKRLVALYVPGADVYDPENDPERNNPREDAWSFMRPVCSAKYDIDFDADLDDSLFSLEPPAGYSVETERRAYVTEEEMIRYLGILAEYYKDTFPDQVFPFDVPSDRLNAISDKVKEDRTAAEQRLHETKEHYLMAGLNAMPIAHFLEDRAAKDSFRYLGKGVRLGDKDRIVCWYKLQNAGTYRVVYGDLSVKDVAPEDLPLPVEP